MTTMTSAAVSVTAAAPGWPWPVDLAGYDRRPDLTETELEALRRLGLNLRRRRCYDRDHSGWPVISRLLCPLARAALWCPDTPHHRRAITDAIGLVLLRCAEENTSFWAWSEQDWLRLIGVRAC
ncbi:hypothetical protein ACGFNP_46805 [Nonomuraea sp. NPDC049269]|uniref:hypothetical protein n=1 Tax=Nonomuraea sp. NPDC049269 TaxID=3364349 RepID=UPI0037155F77